MSYLKIKDLEPWFSDEAIIKVEIKKIYQSKNGKDFMKCIVEDIQKEEIEVLFWNEHFRKFRNQISVGKYYRFKKFDIRPAHTTFNSTCHDYQIIITSDTIISRIQKCYYVQNNNKNIECVTIKTQTKKHKKKKLIHQTNIMV